MSCLMNFIETIKTFSMEEKNGHIPFDTNFNKLYSNMSVNHNTHIYSIYLYNKIQRSFLTEIQRSNHLRQLTIE